MSLPASFRHLRSLPLLVGACAFLICATAGEAFAQDRGFIAVNGAFQSRSTDFGEQEESTFNAERSTESRSYRVDSGPSFDVSGGIFVSRYLAIAGGVSRFSKSGDVAISGRLPHPLFFNRLRDLSGTASGLNREELVFYANAMLSGSVNDVLTVSVFGGPAFFNVTQDLVAETVVNDAFPFTAVSVASVRRVEQSETAVGFNVGADVAVYFTRNVGVGTLLRFSRATVSLPSGGSSIDVDAGGFQIGGGLRLRF